MPRKKRGGGASAAAAVDRKRKVDAGGPGRFVSKSSLFKKLDQAKDFNFWGPRDHERAPIREWLERHIGSMAAYFGPVKDEVWKFYVNSPVSTEPINPIVHVMEVIMTANFDANTMRKLVDKSERLVKEAEKINKNFVPLTAIYKDNFNTWNPGVTHVEGARLMMEPKKAAKVNEAEGEAITKSSRVKRKAATDPQVGHQKGKKAKQDDSSEEEDDNVRDKEEEYEDDNDRYEEKIYMKDFLFSRKEGAYWPEKDTFHTLCSVWSMKLKKDEAASEAEHEHAASSSSEKPQEYHHIPYASVLGRCTHLVEYLHLLKVFRAAAEIFVETRVMYTQYERDIDKVKGLAL